MGKFVFNDKNYSGKPNPINDSIISTNTTWSSDKINNKMDKANPIGTGSLSLNRKANTTIGTNSVAVGSETTASGNYSFAEGGGTTASGVQSHAEGGATTASGYLSHAEGGGTTASGSASHAEGNQTIASEDYAHAEGNGTHADGPSSHAEGRNTTASGDYAHAEGTGTTASGNYSHAEGGGTTASGNEAHAEGGGTTASGIDSHAEGSSTIAAGSSQHAGGKYNVADNNNTYAEIIGNGTANDARSNARTLDWSGNESLAGTIDASGFGTRLSALIPDIPTPTASDIDKVIKVESDGEGGAQYALGQLLVGGRIRVNYNVTLFDQSATTWVDSLTYTATQDCFVTAIVRGDGYSSPLVYVNEENIPFFTGTDNFQHETTLILKKGDTISKRTTSDVNHIFYRFIAYPIYYDNGGHDYSTTEQVIGTWIDGKTLYEKTVSVTIINSSSQVITTIAGAEYKRIEGFLSIGNGVVPVPFNDGASRYVPYTDADEVRLAKISASSGVGNTIVLTLRYTKSST